MLRDFLIFQNAEALWQKDIPSVSAVQLAESVRSSVAQGSRLVQLFGQRMGDSDKVRVYAVVADDAGHRLGVLRADAKTGSSYPSLTATLPQADRAERELFEQCGIRPEGHPWLKPVRHPVPAQKLMPGRTLGEVPENNIGRHYPFWKLAGDAVHEVGVGPVHAGIIGPGYFRFSCVGERIEHLEIMLGVEHRGAEEMIQKAPAARLPVLVESIAGDTSIGYATAYSQAMESLGGIAVSPRAEVLRAIALENERLAYHVGDLGALAGDVAYWPTTAYFGRLRGEFLNTAMDLGGNRQGRYFVRPGGVRRNLPEDVRARLSQRFLQARKEIRECLEQMFSNLSVIGRFDDSACIKREDAAAFGFVGPVARSCGIKLDVRHDHPTGYWLRDHIDIALGHRGSVLDRAMIRRLEIERSLDSVLKMLENLPSDEDTMRKCPPPNRGDFCVSLVEGWRGQVVQTLVFDEQGTLARYKSQDPSFQNWNAMQLANRGNAISDFPVCNKSCNLAYNGHDL